MKTSHQLARELLAGPDLPIYHLDPSRAGMDSDRDTSISEPVVEKNDNRDGLNEEYINEQREEGFYMGEFLTICGETCDLEPGDIAEKTINLLVEKGDVTRGRVHELFLYASGILDEEKVTSPHPTGWQLIKSERERQIVAEMFSSERDDEYTKGQLLEAAICYAQATYRGRAIEVPAAFWPWLSDWFKPSKDLSLNLAKAGALIAAEIDRLKRLERKGVTPTPVRTQT